MTDTKIIIDTDPGVDDALALAYCKQAGMSIDAVTTVYGNSSLANTTDNARYIMKSLDKSWPIYAGADQPVAGEARLAQSHGSTGLGNVTVDSNQLQLPTVQEKSARDFLLSSLSQSEPLAILCLGPLTNLIEAIKDIDDLSTISQVIIMGGAFSERGNVTEYAEFNFYNDPSAADLSINLLAKHEIPTVIIPAEVCRKVVLTLKELNDMESSKILPNIRDIVQPYLDHYLNDASDGKHDGAVLYDVLVPLYLNQPELFRTVNANVNVEVSSSERYGQSTLSEDPTSTVKVAVDIDSAQAKNNVMRRFLG